MNDHRTTDNRSIMTGTASKQSADSATNQSVASSSVETKPDTRKANRRDRLAPY